MPDKCGLVVIMIKHIDDPKYSALIEWLKAGRTAQGLTVRKLALLIEEPHQFVVKVETKERKLNVFEYVQYCDALKLDPAEGLEKLKSTAS